MITITKSKLRLLNACQDQVDLFIDTFGDVEVQNTKDNIQRAIDVGLDIVWLIKQMYPDQYEAIEGQAWAQYNAIIGQAWAQYNAIIGQALAQYKAIIGQAWAQYKAIRGPALAQYKATELSKCVELLLSK